MKLWVVHPACVAECKCLKGRWAYTDESLEIHARIEKSLGARLDRLITPQDFHRLTGELRGRLVTWVDENLREASVEQWLLTPLHKNPFRDNLFLHLSWLALIGKSMRNDGGDLVIVTQCHGLALTLKRHCVRSNIGCQILGEPRFWAQKHYGTVKSLAGFAWRAIGFAYRVALAGVILGREYKSRLSGTEVLVDTYLHRNDLSRDGRFKDRYFPGIVHWYATQGFKCASYPFFYDIPVLELHTVYFRMKISSHLFAPAELFVKLFDLFGAFLTCLRHVFEPPRLANHDFGEVDVRLLVGVHSSRAAMAGFLPLIFRQVPRRLVADGIVIKWFIDWYENQPLDKANMVAFQAIGSPCRVIAVRQYVPSGNLLSLYTTSAEVEAKVAPSENWVCGRELAQIFSLYDSHERYRVVPALRYSHLYRDPEGPCEEKDLLILLTHSLEESMGILGCVFSMLSTSLNLFKAIKIKLHPDTDITRVRAGAENEWPDICSTTKVSWEKDDVTSLLNGARIVVSAGSSTAIEAVCRGVPVVIVGRTAGLTINPMEMVDRRLWELVYDPQELLHVISRWSPAHPMPRNDRISLGHRIRDAYFEPLTDETMKAFLPLPRYGQG